MFDSNMHTSHMHAKTNMNCYGLIGQFDSTGAYNNIGNMGQLANINGNATIQQHMAAYHTGIQGPFRLGSRLLSPPSFPAPTSQVTPVHYASSAQSPIVYQIMSQAQQATQAQQETTLHHAFVAGSLHDPVTGAWNMDTGASSTLNASVTNLNDVFNTCIYLSISLGDGHSILVTNTGHSILPTPFRPLHLNNILITPHIIKNLIFVRQFFRDSNCTIEFDSFGFSVKGFMTRRVLLRCDSMGDLYPITDPYLIPRVFLVSQHTWHKRLGHLGGDVLHHLVSNNVISCNKEKHPVLCHACHLGKH
ncbi:ribonuclease H-like domain-containing protein, partial [Tanacetum coccineum]